MERWSTIENYPNYEVSDLGSVRNKRSGRILKGELVKGYPRVVLCNKNVCRPMSIHRLVLKTFTDNKRDDLQVNHIDGDKTNNSLDNLEWVTGSENILHAYKTGLKHPPRPNPMKIRMVETGEIFNSASECARHIGGSKSHVCECARGERRTHKGYHFEEVCE